jgi:hypothetical protein
MNRQPLLKHIQIIRLKRILDMLYKPSELAEEIGISTDTIYRSYIPAGLPCLHYQQALWIHGPAFVAWAQETIIKRKSKRAGLPAGHAWCMKCNCAVPLIKPRIIYTNQYIQILQAPCPTCQTRINRAEARAEVSS